MTRTVFLLLGSNAGDRERHLEAALNRVQELEGMEVTAASGIYVSEAQDMPDDSPSFLNQVVRGDYQYRPLELLHALEAIERELGRTDKGRNRPRTIDIDILLFGEEIIDEPTLNIPHPEILNRPFVMVPLLEIDPELRHPSGQRPIGEFLTEEDRGAVVLYKDYVARTV